MKAFLIAAIATLSACAVEPAPEPTTTEDTQELSSPLEAAPNLIGEGTWYWCSTSNHYSRTEASCQASCPVTCQSRVICTTGGGQRVPCP